VACVDHQHLIRVNLLTVDQSIRRRAEGIREALSIFIDVRRVILDQSSQVQGVVGRRADAALATADRVNEAIVGQIREPVGGEPADLLQHGAQTGTGRSIRPRAL
jgi:hypothetical protein